MNHQTFLMDKEIVQEIKADTIGRICNNICNYAGTIVIDGNITDCKCLIEFKKRTKFIGANIPKKYWDFNYSYLVDSFKIPNETELKVIKVYCEKLPDMVNDGHGIFLQGVSGLAKSALAAYIAKRAISNNIVTYFTSMSQLTKLIMGANTSDISKAKLNWVVRRVKLLIVDEVDKDYNISNAQTYAGSHVNDFFRTMYEKKISMIVTANNPLVEIGKSNIQSANIVDRFEELLQLTFTGKSFRKPLTAKDLGLT